MVYNFLWFKKIKNILNLFKESADNKLEYMENSASTTQLTPLSREVIEQRIKICPRLPSLSTINNALRELLSADQRYTAQISEIIRRDPSLTARLLRLVNSVYYGLSSPVNSIEEAVFYIGIRQIRQLAMLTPVIEDFQKLAGNVSYNWREFWQHCIGTAIMAREIMSIVNVLNDESDYVAGLVHDVGKIIMASVFPQHFAEIHRRTREMPLELREVENEVLGIDHAELGAIYLENYKLPDFMVEVTRYHHHPDEASRYIPIVCSVNIADTLVRFARIGSSGNTFQVIQNQWINSPAWQILFPHQSETEQAIVRSSLNRTLERLPMILSGVI